MTEPSSTTPDETPETTIAESDPNADSHEGLAGDMGVSSERKGYVRGQADPVTYAAAPTHLDDTPAAEDAPPEQTAGGDTPEVHPDSPGAHPSDPDKHPGHGV